MLSWLFFGTAQTFIGFAKLLFLCTVPVLLLFGPRLGLGVVLLEELVVEVVLSKLAMAVVAPPVGTGGAGSACLGLVAAVVHSALRGQIQAGTVL